MIDRGADVGSYQVWLFVGQWTMLDVLITRLGTELKHQYHFGMTPNYSYSKI